MNLFLAKVFIFIVMFSMSAIAQGSYLPAVNAVKNTQKPIQQLKVKSSQQAAQMAKSRLGGKVLKVQKQKAGYRVKLIKTNGHIVSVYVDAKSGQVNGGN
jgi:uncharacterized membrane protein YkoI